MNDHEMGDVMWKRLAFVAIAAGLCVAGGVRRAGAQEGSAGIALKGADPQTVTLKRNGTNLVGEVPLLVQSTLPAEANVKVHLYPNDGSPLIVLQLDNPLLPPNSTTPLKPRMTISDTDRPRFPGGTVEVVTDDGKASAFATIALEAATPDEQWWRMLLIAAGLSLVTVLFSFLAMWGNKPGLLQAVYVDKVWSFKDSFATNLVALGALLGTVLAASDVLTDIAPTLPSGRFGAMSLLFGGMVVIAPVVYAALGRFVKPKQQWGTRGGLLVATGVTMTAVYGELLAIWLLLDHVEASESSLNLYRGLVALAIAFAAMYAVRSVRWVTLVPAPKEGNPAGGIGAAAAALP